MPHDKDETQGQRKHIEREFETGMDEFFKAASMNLHNNMKRTYDEYQNVSLADIGRNRVYVDKVLSDAQAQTQTERNIANQALQNAVETANMVSKQAVRHSDIAIDRQWNVDEVSTLTAKSRVQADLIQAIAAAIATEMKK